MESDFFYKSHTPVGIYWQSNRPNLHMPLVDWYSTVRTHRAENMSGLALFYSPSSYALLLFVGKVLVYRKSLDHRKDAVSLKNLVVSEPCLP